MTCADDTIGVSLLEFGSLGVALGQTSGALVQDPVTYPSKYLAWAMADMADMALQCRFKVSLAQ